MALNIPILSSLDTKGFDKAAREFKALKTNSEKSAYAISKAALPAAAAIAGLAAAATGAAKAAMDDQAAQVRLAGTLRSTTGATDETIAATETYIDQLSRASAVADDELRPALSSLLLGTKDLGKAQELLAVGLDLSAATGKDLTTVTSALARGYAGNTKGLRTLSPEIAAMIKDGASFSEIMLVLKKNFGGASAAAANTAAGGFKKLKNALNETYENVGYALMPAIDAFLPLLLTLGKFAEDNAAFIVTIGLAIGGFATAIIVGAAAMKIWNALSIITTAVNWALSASYTAVQVATGIGIVTALAGAAAFVVIKNKMDDARGAAVAYGDALAPVISSQRELNNFVGPVSSRDFDTFKKNARDAAAAAAILQTMQDKAKAAAEKLAAALKELKNALIEKMKKALDSANTVLTEATKKFNDFSQSVSEAISSSYSFGDAQQSAADNAKAVAEASDDVTAAQIAVNKAIAAADPEGLTKAYADLAAAEKKLTDAQAAPKTFLDNLKVQAQKVKDFGVLVNRLLAAGLSESALQQVLAAGVDGGTAIANELLGSAGAILEANKLTAEVQTLADSVGKNSATLFYQAGIDAGTNLVNGIKSIVDTYTIKVKTGKTAKAIVSLSSSFTAAAAPVFMGAGAIPAMASGGVVTSPTVLLAGEAGAEAIIPLNQMGNMGGNTNVTIQVNGGDPNAVVDALRRYMQLNGSVPIRVSS